MVKVSSVPAGNSVSSEREMSKRIISSLKEKTPEMFVPSLVSNSAEFSPVTEAVCNGMAKPFLCIRLKTKEVEKTVEIVSSHWGILAELTYHCQNPWYRVKFPLAGVLVTGLELSPTVVDPSRSLDNLV